MRDARLELLPRLLIHGRNADVHTARRPRRQVLKHILVAHDHWPLGDDADGTRRIPQGFERAARQFVGAFDWLIRVSRGAEADRLLRPRRLVELAAQHLDEVGLDENHRRELVVRIELEVRLVLPREAVVAAVRAAAIRVERPLHERHALAPIERGLAADFLVGGGIAAAAGVGQRADAAVFDELSNVAGGGRLAEVEEELVRGHRNQPTIPWFSLFIRQSRWSVRASMRAGRPPFSRAGWRATSRCLSEGANDRPGSAAYRSGGSAPDPAR